MQVRDAWCEVERATSTPPLSPSPLTTVSEQATALIRRLERLMLVLSPSELAETLHDVNVRLRFWLEDLVPDSAASVALPRAATPRQMGGLLSELMRAGEWLRTLPG